MGVCIGPLCKPFNMGHGHSLSQCTLTATPGFVSHLLGDEMLAKFYPFSCAPHVIGVTQVPPPYTLVRWGFHLTMAVLKLHVVYILPIWMYQHTIHQWLSVRYFQRGVHFHFHLTFFIDYQRFPCIFCIYALCCNNVECEMNIEMCNDNPWTSLDLLHELLP